MFNHDELHQVAHTAPIISHLQRLAPTAKIEVITSSELQTAAVKQHLAPDLPQPVFWSIKSDRLSKISEKALGNLLPLTRISGLMANTELFSCFDALVVPETTTTFLKTKCGMDKPKLIFFPHGAGDRSIGFSKDIRHFDYVLLPGEKTRKRMLDAGVIRSGNHRIVGYPKFEARSEQPQRRFFSNDKPVILYNPHFDPKLSSWFKYGEQILDHFASQSEFNLIFAPHVMLFRRKLLASIEHRMLKVRHNLSQRYLNADNIHIDTGSPRSVDMSYTRAADIYLGDVSSQIYEFIKNPRPAIFLNSHNAQWQTDPNYACWKFGPVLDDMSKFQETLHQSLPLKLHFRKIQAEAFHQSFSLDANKSSGERAAEAIADFVDIERLPRQNIECRTDAPAIGSMPQAVAI
ncbi:MAG: hypothetical protein V7676_15395 [Parasphingorhabdus sp.]|uniref:hypothetical protein n=1 Tax=Parasphingorhabdus sp. TaxID=2709688 RepID=UPI003001620E